MYSSRFRFALAAGATSLGLVAAMTAAATAGPSGNHDHSHDPEVETVVAGLDGPRGVDALGNGKTLVTETDGTFSLVIEGDHHDWWSRHTGGSHDDGDDPARVIPLGAVPGGFAPAIAKGRNGWIYILTGGAEPGAGGGPPPGAATLFRWRFGMDAPEPFADIAAYQESDPDPYDQEGAPADTNPFGLAALWDGSVLVSDAAGNDLLRVDGVGNITTVARLLPRTVEVPEGLPPTDPEGNPFPPAGTPIVSEAVATSVTVGPDGYWYVGELRGFPATPGTSQIWRIKPGSVNAVCDPEHPWNQACKRFADGFTSIVDLGASRRSLYVVEISKQGWLPMELGLPGAEVGAVFRVGRYGWRTELAEGQFIQPGGVDVSDAIYVVGPVFGPGSLMKLD
jgi:hypothetical protein